jgi:hypothetical protein
MTATPTALTTIRLGNEKTPKQKVVPGSLEARHGKFEKGAVLPETQVQACPRVKVADLPEGFLPQRFFDALEQNQKIASCCRHPENHEIEALKSHPDEKAPDIYIFHCTCGRKHRRFCVGQTDERPSWGAAAA